MFKAIIFDFGGPIMNYETESVYVKHAVKHDVAVEALRDLFKEFWRGGHRGEYENILDFYEKYKPELGLTIEQLNEVLKDINATIRIDKRMISYIAELKQRGYKTAILSNYTNGLVELLERV